MEQKIIVRHRSGSKGEKIEEFPLRLFKGISMGRDPSCEIAFDENRDDVVSRIHCKIAVEAGNPPVFKLADMGSRNGTFLNRQRISGEVTVTLGDVIQLGPGGPEMEFDVDPRPVAAKATRLASSTLPAAAPNAQMTRESSTSSTSSVTPVISGPVSKSGIGKGTVERMIERSEQKSRVYQFIALAAVLVVAVAGGFLFWQSKYGSGKAESKLNPAEIAAVNTDSVLFFEVGWKIVDIESGRQLHHVAMPNKVTAEDGTEKELVPGAPALLPAFIAMGQQLEPVLSTDDGGGKYKAIGGMHTGSGFVVSSDGFALTNRHVASTWMTRYHFSDPVGVVMQLDEQMNIKQLQPIGADSFPAWVPANARFVIHGAPEGGGIRIVQKSISGKFIEGRNDYMDVTFAKNRVRIPAKLARTSDQIDVAMVKLDIPRSLRKVDMFDNYTTITPGEPVIVLGYPAASPVVVGAVESKDVFNRQSDAKIIPDPTLSVGNIGRVIRAQAGLSEATYSSMGDVYQLTVNSTGPGNSGGPVFDDKGRVIGIFTSGSSSGGVSITFAVPIRYGMELMGINRVM